PAPRRGHGRRGHVRRDPGRRGGRRDHHRHRVRSRPRHGRPRPSPTVRVRGPVRPRPRPTSCAALPPHRRPRRRRGHVRCSLSLAARLPAHALGALPVRVRRAPHWPRPVVHGPTPAHPARSHAARPTPRGRRPHVAVRGRTRYHRSLLPVTTPTRLLHPARARWFGTRRPLLPATWHGGPPRAHVRVPRRACTPAPHAVDHSVPASCVRCRPAPARPNRGRLARRRCPLLPAR